MKIYKYIIYALLIDVIFKDILTGYPFHTSIHVRFIDDILLGMLYLGFIYYCIVSQKLDRWLLMLCILYFLFGIYSVVQSFFGSDLLYNNFLFAIRDNYYHSILLFLFFIMWKKSNINTVSFLFFKIINFYVLSQLIMVGFQEFFQIVTHGSLLLEDEVTGTLGSGMAHILSYSLLMCLPFILHQKKFGIAFFVFLVPFVASARAVILIMLLILLVLYVLNQFQTGFKVNLKNIRLLAIVMLAPLFLFIYNNYLSESGTSINFSALYYQHTKPIGDEADTTSKIAFILYSYNLIQKENSVLFGLGAASYASRTAKVMHAQKYEETINSITNGNRLFVGGSSLVLWLSEYGIIGSICLFILPFVYINKKLFQVGLPFLFSGLLFSLGSMANKLSEAYSTDFIFWVIVSFALLLLREKACLLGSKMKV